MMKETIAVKFKKKYAKLKTVEAEAGHGLAELAYEIRTQFAAGDDGTAEAIDWIANELYIGVPGARSMLRDGEAWAAVRSVEHWVAIGGIKSARMIATLSPK